MNANYKQGYGFENRIVKKLNQLDINTLGDKGLAYRTAGSHSPVDITYTNWNAVYLIQCKHSKKKDVDIPSVLRDNNTSKMEKLRVPFNVVKLLFIKQPRSNTVIQLKWVEVFAGSGRWKLQTVFDLS